MRKEYIDNIRWMTVVLVVIYHVIYMYNAVGIPGVAGPFDELQYQDAIQYLLYPWFMVLLFIVSGMCSRFYLQKHSAKQFIRSRTRKLLVPSTIGLLVFQWLQGYVNMRLGGGTALLTDVPGPVMWLILAASGTGVLWYIQLLWLFSMGLLLIRSIEKGRLTERFERIGMGALLALGVLVWASAQVLNTPIVTVYRFGIYSFCFLLGYFIFAHEVVIEKLERYAPWLMTAAAVLGIGYTVRYFGQNYAVAPAINCPLAMAYCWLACLAVLGAMKRWGNRQGRFGRFMSSRSFGLYIFHYLPISIVGCYVQSHDEVAALPAYLLTAAAAFAGGLLLYEIIRRIPVLRWCVLGAVPQSL